MIVCQVNEGKQEIGVKEQEIGVKSKYLQKEKGSYLNSETIDSFAPARLKLAPNSLAASLAVLPSMSLSPKSSIRPLRLPLYVARVPAAPFASRPFNIHQQRAVES